MEKENIQSRHGVIEYFFVTKNDGIANGYGLSLRLYLSLNLQPYTLNLSYIFRLLLYL